MEAHKRILGILYIVSGILQILLLLTLSVVVSTIFPMIFEHADVEDQWVLVWIVPFFSTIAATIILLMSIPSVIGGLGVLNQKKWALTLVLILGCFKLFSFPIGTALGIYT
ncbi:MAG TPA: hypothetical protein PLR06_09510, partial [Cyclobacteriaceae bacterium]|nr:hypothetical protein [Cyclobacteriaceae bacterium]